MVDAITTNETSFFRDEHPFQTLLNHILPEIAHRKIRQAMYMPPRIRIWSVGCSTGEEPYSIAMCVLEWLDRQEKFGSNDVSIFACDISNCVLEGAKKATYEESRVLSRVPLTYQKKYLDKRPHDVPEAT